MRCSAPRLVMKSEGALQQRMRSASRQLLVALLAVFAVISLWTPLAHPAIAARWFSLPNLYFLLPVPLLVLLISARLWRTLPLHDRHVSPFTLTLGWCFSALAARDQHLAAYYSAIDYLVAGRRPAAKPGFMLVGALLIIPVILGYTCWSYYVFRGKVQPGGLSLMKTVWSKRLLWLIALWGGSVLTLAAISLLFRLLMTASGLKV